MHTSCNRTGGSFLSWYLPTGNLLHKRGGRRSYRKDKATKAVAEV